MSLCVYLFIYYVLYVCVCINLGWGFLVSNKKKSVLLSMTFNLCLAAVLVFAKCFGAPLCIVIPRVLVDKKEEDNKRINIQKAYSCLL